MKKPLILTTHAKNRIDEHGFGRREVRNAWKKARRIDLGEPLLKDKHKYGRKQKNTRYYLAGDILFTVLKQRSGYLCLTVTPKGEYDKI
jgi:hypothetical protein